LALFRKILMREMEKISDAAHKHVPDADEVTGMAIQ